MTNGLPPRGSAMLAVFWREFTSYFGNPTGYVFITLFVFLSAIAAFWQEQFFLANLANLDQLNRYYPYLLIFLIPSITMGLWAEERRLGTEELILTLPSRRWELVLGKYFAALGIYTVALGFSLSHIVVLSWLGSPDAGLMFSTYLGYWLMGAMLLPIGLLASQVTENLTVGFILGAFLCAIPVFLDRIPSVLDFLPARWTGRLAIPSQFRDLAAGVVTVESLVYFVAFAAAALTICIAMAGRRNWPRHPRAPLMALHTWVRGLAAFTLAAALTVLASGFVGRVDVTREQIHSLSPETRKLIDTIDPRKPVLIQAYFSPEVPRSYLSVRSNLVAFLREFDAAGRERIETRIIETVKYSPEAREARERYAINPLRVAATEESGSMANEIFLGIVFTSGNEEFVIPAFDRGLPVEYELMRSIRVVARAQRKRVGILQTPARLFGGLDFQSKRQSNEWSIVSELKKQYDVVPVPVESDYPDNLDVLLAVQPTALDASQQARLAGYIQRGKPCLVLLDPLPAFDLTQSPQAADTALLSRALGIDWRSDQVAWDTYNPHPQLRSLPPEVVFVGRGSEAPMPFQEADAVTAGLQEVVLLYPGVLKPRSDTKSRFTPLLMAGKKSGTMRWNELVQSSFLGGYSIVRGLPHNPGSEVLTLAARINNAIVVADADLMGEEFFDIRRRGVEGMNFDNITFLLNAMDDLSGDRAFIALRKRRPRHRTLEALEARTRVYEEQRRQETQQAAATADLRLREAQARLDSAVRGIQAREDLDEQTRQIMISNVQTAENRRLSVARANIDDERQKQIENARTQMEASVRGIQNTIKLLAIALPPIPAFVLFIFVSIRKLQRERLRITPDRLVPRDESREVAL